MSGTVVERFKTWVDDSGNILHDDCPATYEQAESITGYKLDRRKSYAIIEEEVCELISWSQCCSGCSYGGEEAGSILPRGAGCDECGYTGRRRLSQWIPIPLTGAKGGEEGGGLKWD